MKFSHFFIDRPIFACVISILITLTGLVSFFNLPVAQYPEIAPPTISVRASYSGASPEVLMNTVAAPLEQEINGVEHMLYMQSQCGMDGSVSIDIVFETGADADTAQVLVQNRVAQAESRLPKEVRDSGVRVRKRSPDLLMSANVISPDGSRDKLYLTNYAITQMQDRLSRVPGVSDLDIWGAKEYSMRVWMDPDRLASLNLSPMQIVAALQEQNKQVAAGKLNQPPLDTGAAYELIINAFGRLQTEREFGDIVVKTMPDGRVVHLRDVARIELGAYQYSNESYINDKSTVALGAYQLPGTNAVETMKRLRAELEEMKKEFPPGVDYVIGQDTTEYVSESIRKVYSTIFEAVILVVLVVMLFLQNWRAALIPLFAIPVSLIGTFAMMYLCGFTINNLTLFGLVLAIGIVVDDAIVVVENVERNMKEGLTAKEATKKAMTQVQGALIAIVLVLSCVFVPTAFLGGISGQFYRQFAVTIATSTILSGLVSLTLTPALCAFMLKPVHGGKEKENLFARVLGAPFRGFNAAFTWVSKHYGAFVARLTRAAAIVVLMYGGMLWLTAHMFEVTPTGFIPKQDQGFINVSIQLPEGASFDRTDAVIRRAGQIIMGVEGVRYANATTGRNAATGMASSAAGRITVFFEDRALRDRMGWSAAKIQAQIREKLNQEITAATVNVMTPAPVRGIGSGSDFKFQVQDRAGLGTAVLERSTRDLAARIDALPSVSEAFTSYRASYPQLYAEIDRERAQKLHVPLGSIFNTLQYNLGSVYVNDFNILGRVYRVVAQAESRNRRDEKDIYKLRVLSADGQNIPLGSLVQIRRGVGPDRMVRYNLYPSAEIQGNLSSGYSTGEVSRQIEQLAAQVLPDGMGIQWTDMVYQEKREGDVSMYIFTICVIFVFLLLCALYESWTVPLSVILIVPLVLLFAILGVYGRGLDNNIMTQIGFIVLIGLACKNAILIVEFAQQREARGEDVVHAVSQASRNRLRPILMTSFAFILGVVPLAYGSGSGYELREALGTSVLYGMLGVTLFGCLITPVFYYVIRRVFGKPKLPPKNA